MQEKYIEFCVDETLEQFVHTQDIKQIILSTFVEVTKIYPFDNKIIFLSKGVHNTRYLDELQGIGGQCKSPSCIELTIDVDHPVFGSHVPVQDIEDSVAHELHHAIRRANGIDIEKNILEALLSEGMADYFIYLLFNRRPLWNIKLKSNILFHGAKQIVSCLHDPISRENYSKWFLFGSEEENIPRWFGYSMGFELVAKLLKNDKNDFVSISKLPAETLLEPGAVLKILSCRS